MIFVFGYILWLTLCYFTMETKMDVGHDDKEDQFLFQRISATIQRFNLVLLHDSFSMNLLF